MFHYHGDEEGLTIRVTGDTVQAIEEIAKTLEIDEKWPVFPLAIESLYKVCKLHADTGEKLRDVAMFDTNEENGVFVFDVEAIKIAAKKLEVRGLSNPGDDDEN